MLDDPQDQIGRLRQQVVQLYQQGHYEEALGLATQARDLARQHLGEAHPESANSLNNLAGLYRAMGNYAAAEPLFRQASDVLRVALGEDHPSYAASLNNLALLYKKMGQPAAAEPLYQQACVILRRVLGENHPSYATSLNNLALLYFAMGNYAAAEPLHLQANDILRAALGQNHPSYATSLNDLAVLYKTKGNYGAAEPLQRQATDILRATLGENHPSYATSLNNLARLYFEMGNYAAAEPIFRRILEIRRTTLGEAHPDFATSLKSLAELYRNLGKYAAAEPLYRQALEIKRTGLGQDHPEFATSLNSLALFYHSVGNYTAAEPLYRQALEVERAARREDHPHYATSLNNLAGLYHEMGNYAAAEPLHRQALEIKRTALGEDHPDFATSLNNLALLCVANTRASEALFLMRQAAAVDDRMIGQVFSIGSESHRTAFLKTVRADMEVLLSLVWKHLAETPDAVRAALDLVLRRKAIGAESLAAQRDAVLGGKYPSLEPQLREWTTLRRQIVQKTLAGPGSEGLPAHQKLLAEWNQQKERLDGELARRIPEMNLEQKLRAADRRAVALAAGVGLVEFVRFNVFDFKAVATKVGKSEWLPPKSWQPARYLAFVLPAGKPDAVQMIDLGEAGPIDLLIRDFRAGITGEAEGRAGRDLGLAPVEPGHPPGSTHGQALRATVFDKLVPALAGCKRVLLAPDGDLSRLPFEVLPTADGRRLIDEYAVSYLSCGRDVLRFGVASSGPPAAPLVLADPDFDLATGTPATPRHPANDLNEPKSPLRKAGFWSRWFGRSAPVPDPAAEPIGQLPSPTVAPALQTPSSRRSHDLDRGLRFGRLKGTRLEGDRIAALLGVAPWLEKDALESRIKVCRSPRILHLATHGFFLADQKRDPSKEFRDLGALPGQDPCGLGRLSGVGMENPLLRSGLALAGANTWLKNGALPAEAEDGLLTAEDVTGLDLLDTDLVVLSACETGLGQIHVGEGVFGLRRAFVLAGAKTLVMSLWKVPDQQTQELMEDFYRRLLMGQPRAEALREAQLALKARYPEPLYWGAFICQGDPAPLPERGKP